MLASNEQINSIWSHSRFVIFIRKRTRHQYFRFACASNTTKNCINELQCYWNIQLRCFLSFRSYLKCSKTIKPFNKVYNCMQTKETQLSIGNSNAIISISYLIFLLKPYHFANSHSNKPNHRLLVLIFILSHALPLHFHFKYLMNKISLFHIFVFQWTITDGIYVTWCAKQLYSYRMKINGCS